MDTLQTVATTFMPPFWKYFLIGLVGFILHVVKQLYDKNVAETTLATYWANRKWELIWGLGSYWALIYLWHDGEMFKLTTYIPFLGLDGTKIPLNAGTLFIGYFSSSIMSGVLSFASWIGDKYRAMAEKVVGKKVDEAK